MRSANEIMVGPSSGMTRLTLVQVGTYARMDVYLETTSLEASASPTARGGVGPGRNESRSFTSVRSPQDRRQ